MKYDGRTGLVEKEKKKKEKGTEEKENKSPASCSFVTTNRAEYPPPQLSFC